MLMKRSGFKPEVCTTVGSRLSLSKITRRPGYADYLRFNWACSPIELALEHAGIGYVLSDCDRPHGTSDGFGRARHADTVLSSFDSHFRYRIVWSYVLEKSTGRACDFTDRYEECRG
jgi:hypothetical protein